MNEEALTKVPEVTLVFWIIKIAATTLGETGGDTVTHDAELGLSRRHRAVSCRCWWRWWCGRSSPKKFHPFLYWATIVASTTAGTTMADFADRSLGIGYTGGSTLLFVCLMATLGLWYWSQGSISVETVSTPKVEAFYWATITFSQTLGTALGDWTADTGGLGYEGGALVFGAGLAVLAALYYWTDISRVLLFWAAFILTRPLGATVGDFLDKPVSHGGLALEPAARLGGDRGLHRRLHPAAAAARRHASGAAGGKRVSGGGVMRYPAFTLPSASGRRTARSARA